MATDGRSVRVSVRFGADEFVVRKEGRDRPVLALVDCTHVRHQSGRECIYPLMAELPAVPVAIASPRVLQAMAVDWLERWDPARGRLTVVDGGAA